MSVEPLPTRRVMGSGGGNDRKRIVALEGRMTTVETKLTTAVENTDEILSILKVTKSVGGYVSKYGGRVAIFIGGVAVAKGWIAATTLQSLSHMLGL